MKHNEVRGNPARVMLRNMVVSIVLMLVHKLVHECDASVAPEQKPFHPMLTSYSHLSLVRCGCIIKNNLPNCTSCFPVYRNLNPNVLTMKSAQGLSSFKGLNEAAIEYAPSCHR